MEAIIIKDEPNKKVIQIEMDWHELQNLKTCYQQTGEPSTKFDDAVLAVIKKLS